MKKVSIILLLVTICACSSGKHKIDDDIEVVPVEVSKVSKDASSFIEKMEVVPLETKDSSLIHKYQKFMYDKEMDIFAIYTREQTIFTFSGDGRFISNSNKVHGQGPEEYYMVVDMKFNPYLKGIDLLNPYGTIYTYSPKFEFLSQRKIKAEFPVDYLMALSPNDYIFTYPFLWTDQEVLFANLKTQQMNKASYSGTISGNNMGQECFHRVGDDFYFVPQGLNYYFYKINTTEKKLVPIMYLDFGNSEVKAVGLPGRATGKRVDKDEERSRIVKEAQERYRFVKESGQFVPLMKFFNDDYVYVYFDWNHIGLGGSFIYNRKTKESFLVKDSKPFFMPPCFAIIDNVLLCICPPDRVPDVIERRLMTSEQIQIMEQLKEDDNPVIIKYYLKK
ncbi:6-bladed beta-propeller [Bacteroides sp.]